jgi:hypothetical protein
MSAGTLAAIILSGAVGVSLGALGVGNPFGNPYSSGPRVRCWDPGPASDSTLVDRRRATSIIGAVAHDWRGNNNVNGALLFGVSGIAGSFLRSYLTDFFSDRPLLGVFAALMVIVGFARLRQRMSRNMERAVGRALPIDRGLIVGGLAGFPGISGRFLIIPAVILFAALPAQKAAGTSLAITTVSATAGVIHQLRKTLIECSWRRSLLTPAF